MATAGLAGLEHGPRMDWTQDNGLYNRYRMWKEKMIAFFHGPLAAVAEENKVHYFTIFGGDFLISKMKLWRSEGKLRDRAVGDAAKNDNKIKTYWDLIEEAVKPMQNQLLAVVELKLLFQGNLSLDEFYERARELCEDAGFTGAGFDRMLRDTILGGLSDTQLRDKITRKANNEMTIADVMKIARAEVSTRLAMAAMSIDNKPSVHYMSYDKKHKKGKKPPRGHHPSSQGSHQSGKSNQMQSQVTSGKDTCYRCGKGRHQANQKCGAIDSTCNNCGKKGHYARVCLSQSKEQSGKGTRPKVPKANLVQVEPETPSYYNEHGAPVYEQNMVKLPRISNKSRTDLKIEFPIGMSHNALEKKVVLLADTGCDVNCINEETYHKVFPGIPLKKDPSILNNYGGEIEYIGTFTGFLRWKGKVWKQVFYVTKANKFPNLLCRSACFTMGILKVNFQVQVPVNGNQSSSIVEGLKKSSSNNCSKAMRTSSGQLHSINPETVAAKPLTKKAIVETYKDCFEGLGTFPGEPYKFRLKENAVPAKHGIRKVPLHLQEAFHEEIGNLEKQGILEKVTESTEWVNSYVIVEKETSIDSSNTHAPNHTVKKKLRICLDPRDLNEALEREPYYSRSVDELIAKFHDAIVFSIVDMKKGYWMVVLHPDSRKLTCMALDIGRYQWTRLPMGTVVASDIFQKKLDSIFAGEHGITGIADDMVIYGKTTEEHDRNFLRFMELCRKNNLTLNKDKLQFRQESVSFFGHQWTKNGMQADPKKIKAITSMEFPPDKETCQSFLGMVNYLNRYSPCLAELTDSLRKMCVPEKQYDVKNKEAIRDFHLIKQEVGKKVTLPYFDVNKETILQTDASTKGLGAVLIQENTPVYFASRALTKTEKNSYQNLEREALGTIFGMEKFHYFLYGKHFELQTDQKPLASIFRKHLVDVSPRVQRLVVRSLPYTFTCQWVPGKDIPLADALSRNISRDPQLQVENSKIRLPILAVNLVLSNVRNFHPDGTLISIREETGKDGTLQGLMKYISEGWPENKSSIKIDGLLRFWPLREELSLEDGIILKGNKILVPPTLRMEMLELIHEGHQGVERCINKARESLYWPGYREDIKQLIEKCSICQSTGDKVRKLPIVSTEIPPYPWHTLGSDLFYWKSGDYLLIADYFSKFLIVRRLPSSTAQAVVKELSNVITEYGLPVSIRSDNGPCYAAREFKELMQLYGIAHITSSPRYPQSNGFAESMVKVAKKFMEKATLAGQPWNSGLLEYRRTPLSNRLPSPLEMLMSRKPRTRLPQMASTVVSSFALPQIAEYRKELQSRQDSKSGISTKLEDKCNKYEIGQLVWVQDPAGKGYTPGVIVKLADEPLSYIVDSNGSSLRRTEKHLKPRLEQTNLELLQMQQEMHGNFHSVPDPATAFNTDTISKGVTPPTPQKPQINIKAKAATPTATTATTTPIRRSSRATKGIPPVRFNPS